MSTPIPIYLVNQTDFAKDHPDSQTWAKATGFKADPNTFCLVPGAEGNLAKVLVGKPDPVDTWALGNLPKALPPHTYTLADAWPADLATKLWLGWSLGRYSFAKYKRQSAPAMAELVPPTGADAAYVNTTVAATTLARDLITTPAGDMGPEQLEAAAQKLCDRHAANLSAITGDDLLAQNYPLIHAVGRASTQAPRLLDITWGNPDAPRVTIVGKGVCFDTGGLDIKPAAGMKLMKKDMGGAANALGLAEMVMGLQLPVRLRVLIPAVENSIAGNALHPLDVVPSRRGLTVEVGNTDAEGRLVLADALWEAVCEEPAPQLVVDFATLTGAARIALGTELPACFSNQPEQANALLTCGLSVDDPLWQLPLHQPYRAMLDSSVADLSNISNNSYGGSITAALFLQEFTRPEIPWVHLDLMAWNVRTLPGRPEGGEAMGIRAVFELIRQQVAKGASQPLAPQ
ncbi:leucyl aminopeptidase family protein [Nodosilinea sp. LEGE 07298]|uniref:leucyl aminopeptidase family protein n=1 Tax=Nodosilinea sp. LEGE 07298 TaxID=2777970 RepID=UPI00187F685F|nr:leucyl aminopeptidase family protein [Nodosilinea sp. LEGE 07298]MBE9111974.1 leucyl aminopeptidase family protein [Nodosilinea sp. LEGE 07298]